MLLVLSEAKFHVHTKRLNSYLEMSTCLLILASFFLFHRKFVCHSLDIQFFVFLTVVM